jgi:PAS domain S-box-containing protein
MTANPNVHDEMMRLEDDVRPGQPRAQLDAQKHMLYSLFMQSPNTMLALRGPDFVIEFANPPLCKTWGRSVETLLNRPLLEIWPELRQGTFLPLLEAVYRTGEPYYGNEARARAELDTDGHPLYFNFVYSPYRGISGEVEGVFAIGADVTAQVLARQEIEALREAAEAANRSKDEFLAILGHELRGPLSPILGALYLLNLPGESKRAEMIIERQVNHLARLVDDLLDVSRISRGKVDLQLETLEIAEIVAKAIEMVAPLIEERRHQLTSEVPRDGLTVNGDATRLSQVVSNLLTNAAKYTEPGGRIFIVAERTGDEVEIRLRDTGIGIDPDVLPRVFDLFVQDRLGATTDRALGGLGLGLTIVKSLVEHHGGTVLAKSDGRGRGSEFTIRLPLARATDGAATKQAGESAGTK